MIQTQQEPEDEAQSGDREAVYQAHLRDYARFCRALTWTTVGLAGLLLFLAYLYL